MRGLFVVLEGIDGAGTTTQVARLAAILRAEGHQVLTTREPSDGPVGMLIRQALARRLVLPGGRGALAPETLALLFAADRTDHLAARIRPALEAGMVVLSDRYVLSSLAYQGVLLPQRWVGTVNDFAEAPDLTLFLEVDPAVAGQRRAQRGGAAELFEEDDLQRKIADQYRQAVRKRSRTGSLLRIPGEQPVADVTAQALSAIRNMLDLQQVLVRRRA